MSIVRDPDWLFQAFANLLANAIKCTPVGGIISARCTQLNDKTCFSVSDSGPGIDPAIRIECSKDSTVRN
ncbi:MAG TPA: hypothetical protein EYO29_02985 [Gammaproteobacteria bacterium]|nr:MAG: hypothetical protein DSZ34_06785 [Gammaproteobacteria bacterium]HAD37775.1 hypothetical protein [Gammaproteobacteria bacterium]HBK75902.1 hypothetical protein [Gammaproteobacteria bacterium]HHZ72578.1 hypothetical protein [Gammaproteobacteria bacterium]HIA42369.1 hypothetical protein [Gammaproteobacteria bacterium]